MGGYYYVALDFFFDKFLIELNKVLRNKMRQLIIIKEINFFLRYFNFIVFLIKITIKK